MCAFFWRHPAGRGSEADPFAGLAVHAAHQCAVPTGLFGDAAHIEAVGDLHGFSILIDGDKGQEGAVDRAPEALLVLDEGVHADFAGAAADIGAADSIDAGAAADKGAADSTGVGEATDDVDVAAVVKAAAETEAAAIEGAAGSASAEAAGDSLPFLLSLFLALSFLPPSSFLLRFKAPGSKPFELVCSNMNE